MHMCALMIAICFATNTVAEKLHVSYIKTCNSITSSKTLNKTNIKDNVFLSQEIHQITDIKCSVC